jgi:hypothetical protein
VDHRASWDCKKIEGCHSMYSIASISYWDCTLLNDRELECFCVECMDDNSDFCEMKSHVKPWRLLTLEPLNMSQVPNFDFKVFLLMAYLFCPYLFGKKCTTSCTCDCSTNVCPNP